MGHHGGTRLLISPSQRKCRVRCTLDSVMTKLEIRSDQMVETVHVLHAVADADSTFGVYWSVSSTKHQRLCFNCINLVIGEDYCRLL